MHVCLSHGAKDDVRISWTIAVESYVESSVVFKTQISSTPSLATTAIIIQNINMSAEELVAANDNSLKRSHEEALGVIEAPPGVEFATEGDVAAFAEATVEQGEDAATVAVGDGTSTLSRFTYILTCNVCISHSFARS